MGTNFIKSLKMEVDPLWKGLYTVFDSGGSRKKKNIYKDRE